MLMSYFEMHISLLKDLIYQYLTVELRRGEKTTVSDYPISVESFPTIYQTSDGDRKPRKNI